MHVNSFEQIHILNWLLISIEVLVEWDSGNLKKVTAFTYGKFDGGGQPCPDFVQES